MMRILSLLLFFMCSQLWVNAQHNDKVKVTDVTKTENEVVVNYEILDANTANKYGFTVKLIDSTTFKIIVLKQITGDVNEVTGGTARTIRIPFAANGLDAKANYGVLFLNVTQHTIMVSNNAILKSVMVPGLGNKYLYKNGGAIATTIAIASYGCIGYGVFSKIQAVSSFKSYEEAYLQKDLNKHFNDAKNGQTRFVIFTGVGLGIWALDILHVALKVKSDKKTSAGVSNTSNFSFGFLPPVYNQPNSTTQFNVTYKF